METKEYHDVDKSNWGPGSWQEEPDKVQWRDESTGLPCLVVRNSSGGNWCGYVGVGLNHPLYEVEYSKGSKALKQALERRKQEPIGENPSFAVLTACALGGELDPDPETVFQVHGGITYSDHCQGRICHEVEAGEEDLVWWFGFDCGHWNDYAPGTDAFLKSQGLGGLTHGTYRTLEYAKSQCQKLAEQLREVATDGAEQGGAPCLNP